MEDGYEAIQFAIDNIPFRNTPFIAKNIILITDEGRTPIPQGENITRESIQDELKVHIVQPKYSSLCMSLNSLYEMATTCIMPIINYYYICAILVVLKVTEPKFCLNIHYYYT